MHACRFKSAILTDQRLRVMNEVIAGIRVIKMYAWEYPLKRVLSKIRRYVPVRNYILCDLLYCLNFYPGKNRA